MHKLIMSDDLHSEYERIGEDAGDGLFQGTVRICLGELREKTNIAVRLVCTDQVRTVCTAHDSNWAPSQYKPQAVLLEPTCLVCSNVLSY